MVTLYATGSPLQHGHGSMGVTVHLADSLQLGMDRFYQPGGRGQDSCGDGE